LKTITFPNSLPRLNFPSSLFDSFRGFYTLSPYVLVLFIIEFPFGWTETPCRSSVRSGFEGFLFFPPDPYDILGDLPFLSSD